MSPVKPPHADELAAFFAGYEVGVPRQCQPVSHGIENSNFFVTTVKDGGESEWVLTVLEQPSHSGAGYVPLLDLCGAAGLPVAPVVRTATGDAFHTLNGKPAVLAPRLPGEHVDDPNPGQIETLGRFIADLHGATANPDFRVAPYPRDQAWLARRSGAIRGRMAYTDEKLVLDAADRVKSMLDRRDVQELPAGVVHGDLFRDNLLFDGQALTGVLDFHHAARGYLIYDLAVTVNDWCSRSDGILNGERAAALVSAYHRARPLTVLERCFFPGFLLYAGLAFWLSRLVVALKADAASTARFKDPDEFRAIVADRYAHFFKLDFLEEPVGE